MAARKTNFARSTDSIAEKQAGETNETVAPSAMVGKAMTEYGVEKNNDLGIYGRSGIGADKVLCTLGKLGRTLIGVVLTLDSSEVLLPLPFHS